jgi:hypothetical protein
MLLVQELSSFFPSRSYNPVSSFFYNFNQETDHNDSCRGKISLVFLYVGFDLFLVKKPEILNLTHKRYKFSICL